MPRNPLCQGCVLAQTTSHVCLWGEGARGSVMLVGEAPGADEEASGRPFVGPAGQVLERALVRAGLRREQVYITNVAKCRPPGNRQPTRAEIVSCLRYLAEEVEAVRPRVVVALGATALKALAGKDGITKERGRVLQPATQLRLGEAKLIASFHPAAYLHSGSERVVDALVQDLGMAARLAGLASSGTLPAHRRALFPPSSSAPSVVLALQHLAKATELACDLEWSYGADGVAWPWTRGATLYSVALSGRLGDTVYSVALAWPPPPQAAGLLLKLLRSTPLLFHNAMADLIWLRRVEVEPALAGDTMLLAYLLDEEQGLSLSRLAPLYVGVEPEWKIDLSSAHPTDDASWRLLLRYGTDDAYATLLLHRALLRELGERPDEEARALRMAYEKLLLPAVPAFVSMATAGTPVDVPLLEHEIVSATSARRQLAVKLSTYTSLPPGASVALAMSPTKTAEYLRATYRAELPTTRREAIESLPYSEVPLILGIRHESKVLGTYLEPWYAMATEQGDGRIHTIYRIASTRTGRSSAETERGGSIQLAPREKRIKHLFRAPPGRKIIAADFSQIELRLAAWFAGERTMIRLFVEGADLHRATAAFILAYKAAGLTVEQFWPRRGEYMAAVTAEQRQAAKGTNFGFIYGMQETRFVGYLRQNYGVEVTLEQAGAMRNGYFRLYSGLVDWHKRCEEDFSRGYTKSLFGRYRRNLADPRKAINTPVQATASDMTMLAMTEIRQRFRALRVRARLVGFIHDAILVEADDGAADEAARLVKNTMENLPLDRFGIEKPPIPIVADVGIGQGWDEARS